MRHRTQIQAGKDDRGTDSRSAAGLRADSREPAGQDGRAEARDSDRAEAAGAATVHGDVPAPEIPPGAEDLIAWDVSPDDAGHLVAEIEADDEADVQAEMAEQGRDDADDDMRRAGDPNTN